MSKGRQFHRVTRNPLGGKCVNSVRTKVSDQMHEDLQHRAHESGQSDAALVRFFIAVGLYGLEEAKRLQQAQLLAALGMGTE